MATTRPRTRARATVRTTQSVKKPAFNLKLLGVFVVLSFVVVTGAYLLGNSDKGVIDVSAAITNSNATQRMDVTEEDGTPEARPIPAQFRNATNGGLVPSNTARPEPASSQAEPELDAAEDATADSQEDVEDGTEASDASVSESDSNSEADPATETSREDLVGDNSSQNAGE